VTENTRARPLAAPRAHDRRLLLVFLLAGIALILLLLNLAGSQKTFTLIIGAQPAFVLAVLIAQVLRYAGSTGSTQTLAKTFGRRLPLFPLYETMLAGQALNRTFSVGGAAGMWARYSFLTRQGMHSGAVAALFVVEDLLGAAAIALVFTAGFAAVIATTALPQFSWLIVSGFVIALVLASLAGLNLYRRRALLERIVHAIARTFNTAMVRLIGKEIYDPAHIKLAIDEFYLGMTHARRDPLRVASAFLFNLLRLGFDAASLYFAFWAIGFSVAPAFLLVIFTSSSALSTLSGVPGELGVMETALAILSTSLGIPPPAAVSAIVLFRALSYWLPIPVGYLAFGDLERRGLI
jgi:uncharacterized protein (TIRG00374 family)